MSVVRFCLAASVALLLVGCSGTNIDDTCFFGLGSVNPSATQLVVGDTLTFDVSAGPRGCLPAGLDRSAWRWSSGDTLIASIDALSGLARARSPGQVMITVHHAQDPSIGGGSTLNVVAAAP
jgi:hypothetical protein